MSNATGSQETGLNKLFKSMGLGFLANDWFKTDSVWAMGAVALAAGWALVGYIMALFLAGMRGVSDDLKEAARVDGANEVRVFWYVTGPMLWPVVMAAIVILTTAIIPMVGMFDAALRAVSTSGDYGVARACAGQKLEQLKRTLDELQKRR